MAVPGTSMKEATIIIPYKNTAAFLRKMLSSIFRHKLPFALQVIVINDHSTENLEEYRSVAEEYRHCVEFYDNDSDVYNAGAARNIGLQYAKGEWLLFADADDYFTEGWEVIVNDYLDRESDIIFFSPISADEDNRPHTRHLCRSSLIDKYIRKPNDKNEIRLRYGFVVPWSKLIRRRLVYANDIKFDEVMYGNDVMFSMKCSYMAKTIDVSNATIYCVMFHANTLTTQRNMTSFYGRTQVGCNRFVFLKKRLSKKEFHYLDLDYWAISRRKKFFSSFVKREISREEYRNINRLFSNYKIPFVISPLRYFVYSAKEMARSILRKVRKNRTNAGHRNK